MSTCSDLKSPEEQQFLSFVTPTFYSEDEVPSHKREEELPGHVQGGHHGREDESLNKGRGLKRKCEFETKEVKQKNEVEKLATKKRKVDKVLQVVEAPATKRTAAKKPAALKPATKDSKIPIPKAPWR